MKPTYLLIIVTQLYQLILNLTKIELWKTLTLELNLKFKAPRSKF
jgi:hypothetical protein